VELILYLVEGAAPVDASSKLQYRFEHVSAVVFLHHIFDFFFVHDIFGFLL